MVPQNGWFQVDHLKVFYFGNPWHLLRKKLPYLKFLCSIFSRIRTEYLCVLSSNAGKYGLKKLQIRTLFTQWLLFLTLALLSSLGFNTSKTSACTFILVIDVGLEVLLGVSLIVATLTCFCLLRFTLIVTFPVVLSSIPGIFCVYF